jgi:hypothetical protein
MDKEDVLRATIQEANHGFALKLEKTGGGPWESVQVIYNRDAEILTVRINGEHTWEHPIKGSDREGLRPTLLGD